MADEFGAGRGPLSTATMWMRAAMQAEEFAIAMQSLGTPDGKRILERCGEYAERLPVSYATIAEYGCELAKHMAMRGEYEYEEWDKRMARIWRVDAAAKP